MSDSDKRPGVRDISDLKARLGLKKKRGKKGAAIPPPGAGGAPVPAPPGAAPPQPTAATDPFGAMNVAASQRAAQAAARGPEIVVIEKGEEVETVERKSQILKGLKIAGIIILPLAVGIAVGQISMSAKQYNRTIRDAGMIQEDVKVVRKSLVPLQYALLDAKKKGFPPNDPDLAKELEGITIAEPNTARVYKSWLYEMDSTLVQDVLTFYTETLQLTQDLQTHVTLTKRDSKGATLLQEAADNEKAAEPIKTESGDAYTPYRFAMYVEIPTQQDLKDPDSKKVAGAKLVEIGQPVCEDRKPSETGECPGKPIGFRYRLDATGKWGLKELAPLQPGATSVEVDKLLVVYPTGVIDALIKNNEPSVAELYYQERLRLMTEKVSNLIEIGTDIEGKLKAKSNESKRFTFFL